MQAKKLLDPSLTLLIFPFLPGATVKTGQELLAELFPVVKEPDTPGVQRQDHVETETLCCSKERHDLRSETVYKPIRDASYFYKGKRWDTLSCRHCRQTFVGDKKPTDRNPVYVCNEYELRKTDCKQDGAVCYACYSILSRWHPRSVVATAPALPSSWCKFVYCILYNNTIH